MKNKKFRIGNLIYAYSLNDKKQTDLRIAEIKSIGETWIEYDYQGEFNHCSSKPIPLTEEWLEKFGLKKLIPQGSIFQLREFHVQNFGPLGFYECRNHVKIEYIHQLQNLYFALTGEELTIR